MFDGLSRHKPGGAGCLTNPCTNAQPGRQFRGQLEQWQPVPAAKIHAARSNESGWGDEEPDF